MKVEDADFLKIFHNNLVGMIITNEDHIIVDINDHLLNLAELDRKDVIGKTGLELGLLNEEFVKSIWEELFNNVKLLNKEFTFKTKLNKTIHCLFSTEKIEINDTKYWLTTLIDVSKKRRTEKELADVYNRVTDGVVAFDAAWNYTYVNRNAGLMMQRDHLEMIGRNVWIEFPHLVGSDIQRAYFSAMEKQEMTSLEQYFPPFDIWYLHVIYPSPDAVSVFFKDISFRKRHEQRIEESEHRFRTLTKTAPVGIFETDASGSTTYVNETWKEYTGLSSEEAMGDGWLAAVHIDDRKELAEGWYKKAGSNAESASEYRVISRDGRLRWLSGRAVAVINTEGNITGYIGIVLDVTEQKKYESALQESSLQLRELSRHLQNIREDERMRIAREIHDELGQQLTGLKMDIAWLMKKAGQEDEAVKVKFDDALELVDSTVRSIRRIATELRPSIIDDLGLNAALEWLVAEFAERLNVDIEYENNFDDKNVSPDIAIGLFRILQESLTNIAKHANATKIAISITNEQGAIRLLTEDNGIGFDTTAKPSQLKFGLLGIKERTYMMKGEYSIYSKPGKGTKIEVSIQA